jgi:hypothetical protein
MSSLGDLLTRVQPKLFCEITSSHVVLLASFQKGKVSTNLGSIQGEHLFRVKLELSWDFSIVQAI